MWSQLSETEKKQSSVSFEKAMTDLSNWHVEHKNPTHMPTWTEWEDLSELVLSGNTALIHRTSGLLVGVRLKDGSEYIGTQTRLGDLDKLLTTCGPKCETIDLQR